MGKQKLTYYYQINFIDEQGNANYIDTFTSRQRKKAIEHLSILNSANQCLTNDTYFVLDKYARYDEDGNDMLHNPNAKIKFRLMSNCNRTCIAKACAGIVAENN